ncbi:MAG TPA: type II toxin-antitoxin system prevent-host-death family antitoxin [Chthoniobacteraceae bacterium]|nr:type II toxin-antitoxin system prevent-host-death family antitoxin [Chthoniobacteraceae bacterium]
MPDTELVTTLKRNATKIIADVRRKQRPVLITERGLPAAYLVDVASFEALQSRVEVLEGIARGEMAVREGRILPHDQARKKMKRWLK